jgi:hypothetical protein
MALLLMKNINHNTLASKRLGWAGGSHVEFGMSSSTPNWKVPELAPCGWCLPHWQAPHAEEAIW